MTNLSFEVDFNEWSTVVFLKPPLWWRIKQVFRPTELTFCWGQDRYIIRGREGHDLFKMGGIPSDLRTHLIRVHGSNRPKSGRTFDYVSEANLARCKKWHPGGVDDWTVADWAVAMGGEAGEVLNAVKKLRRLETGIHALNGPQDVDSAIRHIKKEIGDVYLYLDLLCHKVKVRIEDCIVLAFDSTSIFENFEDRL